jgi:hypothetical protein
MKLSWKLLCAKISIYPMAVKMVLADLAKAKS